MSLSNLRLSTRITLAVLFLVLAAGWLLVTVIDHHQRDNFLSRQAAQLGDSVRLNGARVRQTVDTLRQDVLFLSRTPPTSGIARARLNGGVDPLGGSPVGLWEKRMQEVFGAFAEAHPNYYRIRYIGVSDGGGELVRVDLEGRHARVASADELRGKPEPDYLGNALNPREREVYLSEIALVPQAGRLHPLRTLRAATPVFAPGGQIFGMVVIDMNLGETLDAVTSGLPAHVTGYVTNAKGDYLSHPDHDPRQGKAPSLQHDFPSLAALFEKQASDHWPLHAVQAAAGMRHMAIERIRFDPLRPERFLTLAYAMPDQAIQEETSSTRREAVAGVVVGTILMLWLVMSVLKRMFAPLSDITRAAETIAEGGYDAPLPKEKGGEIGALTGAFRVMLDRVRRREQDYLRLNEKLEQRVRERTAELEAREADLKLAASVFHNTTEGVLITDAEGTILSVNPAFSEITGYAAAEAIGRKPSLLRSDHHGPEFYRAMWDRLLSEGQWQGEIWNRRKNGEAYPEWLTISTVPGSDGVPMRYVSVFSDMTEVRRKDEHIRHQAFHDALTGLPNRALLLDRLEHGIEFARRDQGRLGVVFIDLDRFKAINDTLGHDIGDGLLREVGERLSRSVRGSDTVARMGGDEFVILLEEVEEMEALAVLAKKVVAAISAPMDIGGHAIQVGASVGIACYPDDGVTAVMLMKNADAAMYGAKSAGRGVYRFFQPAMTEKAAHRLKLEMELRNAVGNRELELHYQPKLDLATNEPCGMEALVRWRHPEQGLLPPAEFIPIAEETGIINEIGNWVLEETCRQLAEWRDRGMKQHKVAVNVSARQLQAGNLIERIDDLTRQYGIAPSCLEIELTESVIMANPEDSAAIFTRLRQLGVSVAVDDFGTGYSSLAYLRRLPIDVLKIDRSFVSDAVLNVEDAQIVRTILALGQALKLTVVAEGIETEQQADFLRSCKCAIGQGYMYSRPIPAAEMEAWLNAR